MSVSTNPLLPPDRNGAPESKHAAPVRVHVHIEPAPRARARRDGFPEYILLRGHRLNVMSCKGQGNDARLQCDVPTGHAGKAPANIDNVISPFIVNGPKDSKALRVEIPLNLINLTDYRENFEGSRLYLPKPSKADPLAGLRHAFEMILGPGSGLAPTAAAAAKAAICKYPDQHDELRTTLNLHSAGRLAEFFSRHSFLWDAMADYAELEELQIRAVVWPDGCRRPRNVDLGALGHDVEFIVKAVARREGSPPLEKPGKAGRAKPRPGSRMDG